MVTIGLHVRLLPAGATATCIPATLQARHAGQHDVEVPPLAEDASAERLDARASAAFGALTSQVIAGRAPAPSP